MFLPWVRDYQTITLWPLHQPLGLELDPQLLVPTTYEDQRVSRFPLLQSHQPYPKRTSYWASLQIAIELGPETQ